MSLDELLSIMHCLIHQLHWYMEQRTDLLWSGVVLEVVLNDRMLLR